MRYIDLFSGIGGFALGLRQAGIEFEEHWFSEIDKNAINIYKKHFPNAKELGDVRAIRDFSGIKADIISLNILSLKTSKVCLQITEELTLSDVCGKLPTLGYMSASGSLLIQAGYYPKIASGFTLSDILEENPAQKYFLSPVATKRLMEYKDNVQIPLRATDIQKSDKHRMLLKVNSLRKSGK